MFDTLRSYRQQGFKLLNRIDPVTHGWVVILAGTAVRIGLSFLSGILIVRTLGPVDFGIYSLLTAAAGLAGVMIDFGLTEAGVKRIAAQWNEDRFKAFEQAQIFFWLRLALAGAGLLLGVLLAQPISSYLFKLPDGAFLFSLALIGAGATVLSGSVNAMLQATAHFGRISAVLVASSALALALAVLLWLAGQLNLISALLGLGAGTALAGFLIGYFFLPQGWRGRGPSIWRFPAWPALRREAAVLLRFGRWLWLANIFKTLIAYLDFFLVNLWLAPATVGIYALALGLAARAEIVNHSLYTVLIPMASALKQKQALKEYLSRGLVRSGLISLGLLLLAPAAHWFIPFFYGPEYLPAVRLFQLLLGVVIFDILTLPATLLIYTFDRPDLSALAEGVRVVILILIGLWAIPAMGPAGAVLAKFCAKAAGVAITMTLLAYHYLHQPQPEGIL
jgi:O-antigen/teichoic acid export membrane protein